MSNRKKRALIDNYKVEQTILIQMTFLIRIQQSGQMSGHMTTQTGNQETIFLITLILGLIIVALLAAIFILIYLFYTGRIHFTKNPKEPSTTIGSNQGQEKVSTEYQEKNIEKTELPPVSLNPLERKILEVIITGHNVLQSDLPKLVNSSKSKVSEALTNLEEKKLIQRYKAGRSLTIKYTYQPTP